MNDNTTDGAKDSGTSEGDSGGGTTEDKGTGEDKGAGEGENEGEDNEGTTEIKWRKRKGEDGSRSRIRKEKDSEGNTTEVWHEVYDKNGNLKHRDWKGPGPNPYGK